MARNGQNYLEKQMKRCIIASAQDVPRQNCMRLGKMANDPDDGGRAPTKNEIIAGWVILLLLTALGLLTLV